MSRYTKLVFSISIIIISLSLFAVVDDNTQAAFSIVNSYSVTDQPAAISASDGLNALLHAQILPSDAQSNTSDSTPTQDYPVRVSTATATGPITFETNRNGTYDIYNQDAAGDTPALPVTTGMWNDFTPSWSPDGTQVVFVSDREGSLDIFLYDAEGRITNLTHNPADDAHPHWSPTGDRIIFTSNRNGEYFQIFTMLPDGSDVRQMTQIAGYHAMYPRYSPDANRIAFMRASITAPICDWNWDVWVMDAQGNNQQRVTTTNYLADLYPNWTPNGNIIYASCRNFLDFDLYTVNLNTGAENQITSWLFSNEWGAVYGEDQNYVAFNSDVDGNTEIYIGSFIDGTATNLTQNSAEDLAASWRTDVTIPPPTYLLSGRVTDDNGNPIPDVIIWAGFPLNATTNEDGYYSFENLPADTYTLTPQKDDHTFTPASFQVEVPTNLEVNFVAHQPVIVLVHGFQGLSPTPLICSPFSGSGYVTKFNGSNSPYQVNYWQDAPFWLDKEYDVWVAQLQTGRLQGTPSLYFNALCLQAQVNYVANQNGNKPITLIGHSMGGLVSRGCLSLNNCRERVDKLVTLGSPHAGIPAAGLAQLLLIPCALQPGVCEMSDANMPMFNTVNYNQPGKHYLFISGSHDWDIFNLGWFWEQLGSGPNDGLVGKYSGVGWIYPYELFSPPWWSLLSPPKQVWTDEVHSRFFEGYNYNNLRGFPPDISNAYRCYSAWLKNPSNNLGDLTEYCSSAQSMSVQTANINSQTFQTTASFSGMMKMGDHITRTLEIDTNGSSQIMLTWEAGTLDLTLTRPDGEFIDPDYAALHPDETAYRSYPGSAEYHPYVTYTFTNTVTGSWQLHITAGEEVGTDGTDYRTLAAFVTHRTLTAGSDASLYEVGQTAVITATLQNNGAPLTGKIVTATFTHQDNTTDSISLMDQGDGSYQGSYIIPDIPGFTMIAINASGNDAGADFSREQHLMVSISPHDAQFMDIFADQPIDGNGNGLYESLDFLAEIQVNTSGDYLFSADLTSGEKLITHAAAALSLEVGLQTITLQFNGDEIRAARLNGPYTIANLHLIPVGLGIPADVVGEAWVTPAYDWRDFGSDWNLYLPLALR